MVWSRVGARGLHDEHGILAEPFARLERERWAEVVDDAFDRGLRATEERSELARRQVRSPVARHEQHPALQRMSSQAPLRTGSAA